MLARGVKDSQCVTVISDIEFEHGKGYMEVKVQHHCREMRAGCHSWVCSFPSVMIWRISRCWPSILLQNFV